MRHPPIVGSGAEHAGSRRRSIYSPAISKESIVNKDRVSGAAKEAVGSIKEKTGKVLGDKKMEVEGKVKKTEGKVQNAIGGAEDAAEDAARETERAGDKGRW
jgi:uncharacterized protein YjbJ (UPF0337 family)